MSETAKLSLPSTLEHNEVTRIIPVVLPRILSGFSVREIAEQHNISMERVKEQLVIEISSIHNDSLSFANIYSCLSMIQLDVLTRAILKQVEQSILSPEQAADHIAKLTIAKMKAAETVQKIALTKRKRSLKTLSQDIAKALSSIPTEQLLKSSEQL